MNKKASWNSQKFKPHENYQPYGTVISLKQHKPKDILTALTGLAFLAGP